MCGHVQVCVSTLVCGNAHTYLCAYIWRADNSFRCQVDSLAIKFWQSAKHHPSTPEIIIMCHHVQLVIYLIRLLPTWNTSVCILHFSCDQNSQFRSHFFPAMNTHSVLQLETFSSHFSSGVHTNLAL